MQELQDEVAHLKSVEEEITGYAERALAETERLTKENGELRKAQEDAGLDRWETQPTLFVPGSISAAGKNGRYTEATVNHIGLVKLLVQAFSGSFLSVLCCCSGKWSWQWWRQRN